MGAFTAKQEGWYFDPATGEIIDPAHDEEDMSGIVARIEVYQADNANDRADGYLLAAAPDMQTALEAMIATCKRCDGRGKVQKSETGNVGGSPNFYMAPCPHCTVGRAALAKAHVEI